VRRLLSWFRSLSIVPRVVLGLLGALVLALVVGAVTLATVPFTAPKAKAEAEAAAQSLRESDFEAAADRADSAGRWASWSSFAANWWGADLWALTPVVGDAVDDVQHLASALDGLTEVLAIGVDVAPQAVGPDAGLLEGGGSVDLEVLEEVLDDTREIPDLTGEAADEIRAIEADAPVVGARIAAQRDAAARLVLPLADGLDAARPLWDRLPDMLGASGARNYVVAFLNPAEQHYSGGTPLTFAPMSFHEGELVKRAPLNQVADPEAFQPVTWKRVWGNSFHRGNAPYRLTASTTPPSWSVAGEELLRAWKQAKGRHMHGVVALDVVALQRLVGIVGPMQVPGFGTLDGSNLTERLIGSYDELTSLEAFQERNRGEAELMTTFQDSLLDKTNLPSKVRTLGEAARQRHFAMYLRDPDAQAAVEGLGLDGDLSDTPHDYIGVFNQAVSGLKSDYWQRRTVTSDVRLAPDGSARVVLEIEVFNDAPAPAVGVESPFTDYVRRDNETSLAAFMPLGSRPDAMELDGASYDEEGRRFRSRRYIPARVHLEPGGRTVWRLEYDVEEAAVKDGSTLTYHLDADPQGMVDPQALDVTVHWPQGYTVGELPAGWKGTPDGARFSTPDFDEVSSWSIPASR